MNKENLNATLPRRKRLRFKEEDEMALLTEVLNLNPFNNAQMWENVQENIMIFTGKFFLIKTLKDHLDLIIEAWLEKIKKFKDRSGIELEYTTKEHLLEHVYNLMMEYRTPTTKKTNKEKPNTGSLLRENWASKIYQNQKQSQVEEWENNFEENIIMEVPLDEGILIEKQNLQDDRIVVDHAYANNSINDANQARATRPNKVAKKANTGQETYETGKYSVLQKRKSRARKMSIQKQGIQYLEAYDQAQNELRQKEVDLQQQKIEIDKEKLKLEKSRLYLKKKKMEQIETQKKKQFKILENCISNLNGILQNQEKLIYFILSKN